MDLPFLGELFPFQNLSPPELCEVASLLPEEVCSYNKNDVILSKEQYCEHVGFVISGECAVYRERERDALLLQTLRQNDSFGILTLFCDEEYPTVIVAKKQCRIYFIEKNCFLTLVRDNGKIAMNVMRFLAKKVNFLNQKIALLCGSTVEEKVECYLYSQMQLYGNSFSFNAKRAAEQINIGRASLYRALQSLSDTGIIEFQDKTIIIKCPKGLERTKK